jgi:hypothetical protein
MPRANHSTTAAVPNVPPLSFDVAQDRRSVPVVPLALWFQTFQRFQTFQSFGDARSALSALGFRGQERVTSAGLSFIE